HDLDPRRGQRRPPPADHPGAGYATTAEAGPGGYPVPAPGGTGYRSPPRRPAAPPRPRSGRRRAVLVTKVIAGLLSGVVLVASGWLWVLVRQFNTSVNRINAITNSGSDVDGTDQNILLVGNDNRGGLTDAQLKEIGTTLDPGGGFNTDTILLV